MIILMDNGSLEPSATFALRALAARMSEKLGLVVAPVSLLHSSKISAARLDGIPAETLEGFLRKLPADTESEVRIVPLFFGPSFALCDYLPTRLVSIGRHHPRLSVTVAPCLCGDTFGEEVVVGMLERSVRERLEPAGRPLPVVLVDHGTPSPAVTAVRDRLAMSLGDRLGDLVSGVLAASMERRDGDEFAFNDPLLESALRMPGYDRGEVIVALQFLFPGRHAGPGGDIARICAKAEAEAPGLICRMTRPLGEDEALVELLVRRAQEGAFADAGAAAYTA